MRSGLRGARFVHFGALVVPAHRGPRRRVAKRHITSVVATAVRGEPGARSSRRQLSPPGELAPAVAPLSVVASFPLSVELTPLSVRASRLPSARSLLPSEAGPAPASPAS